MKHVRSVFLIALLSLTACGGCSNNDENNTPQKDMTDMVVDMPDMEKDDSNEMSCLTECPASACGMVDDTCGGQLDCGACLCEDNKPTQAGHDSCGTCGIGRVSCTDNSCAALDIVGLKADECNEMVVYVDHQYQGASEEGRKNAPYKTLAKALELLPSRPKARVIIMRENSFADNAVEPETLKLVEGVSIIGGFDEDWNFPANTNKRTHFTVENREKDIDQSIGAIAQNINTKTYWWNISVNVTNAKLKGSDVLGFVIQNSPGLDLNSTRFFLDSAQNGEAGERGQDGERGKSGQSGIAPNAPNISVPGDAGTNDVCMDGNGGQGGRGGVKPAQQILAPDGGQSSPTGVAGGMAGTMANKDGQPGSDAMPFAMGAANGMGGVLTNFEFKEGKFLINNNGADGTDGQNGQGAGGGGGGYFAEPTNNAGPSGGGGGAGGCGGVAGKGGQGGGSSIALLVVDSQGIVIKDSEFTPGIAGEGGNGGVGGEGGQGGNGGPGATVGSGANAISSGAGGKGADGQKAGDGGGGAGGYSIGAWCFNTTLSAESNTFTKRPTPSRGGSGTSPGADGINEETKDCGL